MKEQLLYEIGDPGAYLSPDVTLSLLGLEVKDEGDDRDRRERETYRATRRRK